MARRQSKVTNNTNNSSNKASKCSNVNTDNTINNANCKNNKKNFGLMNYTYADYVILSSTLAYAIGEELDDTDLTLFLVFLSQLSADLSLIITKRGLMEKQSDNQSIVPEIESEEQVDDINSTELGKSKKRKVKKIKKRKRLSS